MEIRTENDVAEAVQSWQGLSVSAQKIRAKQAIEKLELNQMYYEQKGNEKSAGRAGNCIQLFQEFLDSCE